MSTIDGSISDRSTDAATAVSGKARGVGRFLRSGQVRLGIALLVITLAFALIGPLVTPFDPTKVVTGPYARPDGSFWLGADQLGRDVLSRTLAGGIHLAWMAPVATVLGVGAGAIVGLVAVLHEGVVDVLFMRAMDIILAFPGIILALLFVSVLGPEPWLLVLLVALALLPGVARVIYAAAVPITQQEFILWARTVGTPKRVLLMRELLPNVASPLLVEFGVRLMWSIGILASLSFIGYGVQPPTADWGLMVSENRTGLATQPLAVLAPIVLIVLFTVGGNLIAEGSARVIARTEGKA